MKTLSVSRFYLCVLLCLVGLFVLPVISTADTIIGGSCRRVVKTLRDNFWSEKNVNAKKIYDRFMSPEDEYSKYKDLNSDTRATKYGFQKLKQVLLEHSSVGAQSTNTLKYVSGVLSSHRILGGRKPKEILFLSSDVSSKEARHLYNMEKNVLVVLLPGYKNDAGLFSLGDILDLRTEIGSSEITISAKTVFRPNTSNSSGILAERILTSNSTKNSEMHSKEIEEIADSIFYNLEYHFNYSNNLVTQKTVLDKWQKFVGPIREKIQRLIISLGSKKRTNHIKEESQEYGELSELDKMFEIADALEKSLSEVESRLEAIKTKDK